MTGLGTENGLCFEETQGGVHMVRRVVGNTPRLQNAGVTWAE